MLPPGAPTHLLHVRRRLLFGAAPTAPATAPPATAPATAPPATALATVPYACTQGRQGGKGWLASTQGQWRARAPEEGLVGLAGDSSDPPCMRKKNLLLLLSCTALFPETLDPAPCGPRAGKFTHASSAWWLSNIIGICRPSEAGPPVPPPEGAMACQQS